MGVQHIRCEPVRIDQAFADVARLPRASRPAVTIVTPFFNMAEFIGETADSVFRQTFRDFEWLIINDGSTDPMAVDVLDTLARRDRRVRVLHQNNVGLAATRNRGFREATGEYVAQLDADDLLAPTFLEKCLWFLETHLHCAWAHTGSITFGVENFLWLQEFKREMLLEANVLVVTSVVRRSAHLAIGGYDESIRRSYEDWDYWLRMVSHGYTSKVIPEHLCWYRRRPNSMLSEAEKDQGLKVEFTERMRQRYGQIFRDGLPPMPEAPGPPTYPFVNDHLPFTNCYPPDERPGILFLWPWLAIGGADKFNLDLLRGLDQSRVRPYVVTTVKSEHPWGDRFVELTPEIFHLPNVLPVEDWLRFLVYLIRSRDISLIFLSNSEYGYQCVPALKKVFPHLRVIDFVHAEQMDWKGGGYAYASKSISSLLSRSLVSSQHLRRVYLEQFSRDPEQVHCVYIDVDAEEEFHPERFTNGLLRREVGCQGSIPVLLYVARICAPKRPETLIEIAFRLRTRSGKPFQVWIVGDGPDLPEMRNRCSTLGMDGTCVFWGSRRDTGQFYREADILVLPSAWEGIALTLYEAMAMGLAVVASDVGGQRELVTPETGVLIPPGVPDEVDRFVDSILHLMEYPAARQQMGEAGRERVRRHFPLSKMVEEITGHLTSVLQERGDSTMGGSDSPLWLDRYSQWLEAHRLEAISHCLVQGRFQEGNITREREDQSRATHDSGLEVSGLIQESTRLPARADSGKVTVLMEVRSLDTGGLEEVVFNLARSLDKERFNALIVCVEGGGHVARRCREHGIAVEVLGGNKQAEYTELLARYHVDLVCAHYSTFGAPLAFARGIPLISVIHNLYAWLPDDVFSDIKTNDRYVSKYVAVSDGVAQYLCGRFNILPERVSVIHNGLDVEALAAREREPLVYSRKDFGLSEDDYLFLHVAAVTEVKGHNALIRAMKEMVRESPQIKVLCVGGVLSQGYSDLIRRRVKEWGLEGHVLFPGFVERITDLYRLADAFVLPSIIEGWSLAVGEAMFFRLPMILTRVGGAVTLFDKNDVGRLIEPSHDDVLHSKPDEVWHYGMEEDPRNVPQLVEAMSDFYERRAFWKKAAKKGRAKILKSYTLQIAARRYEELFLYEVVRAKQERERDFWNRLDYTRSLEQVSCRLVETQAQLDEIAARGAEQAQRLTDLEARQQARLEAVAGTVAQQVADLEARRQAQVDALTSTVTHQLADLEARQQAQVDALTSTVTHQLADLGVRQDLLTQHILDRLSIKARLKARLTHDLRALEALFGAIVGRIRAQLAGALRAIKARLPYGLRHRLGSLYYLMVPSARPITHRPSSTHQSSAPFSREEAYRHRVDGIVRLRHEMTTVNEGHRTALDQLVAETRCERIAIYPPTLIWGEHLFQRPQQIFRALAKKGMLGFYCSTSPLADGFDGFRKVADHLFLCSDIGLLRGLDERAETILWMTRPDHRWYSDLFPGALTVYEMIDELEVFPEYCGAMERDHLLALAEADVVVATARKLYERIRPIREDVILAPNGVCLEDFQIDPHLPGPPSDMERIVRRGKPIVGYYGALAEWFDYELVNECARACKGYSFVLIGPDYDGSARRLKMRRNVFWLGPKKYSELKQYLRHFDVATIPFQINAITESTSPIKLFEFMAGGKPVVTTALPECSHYRSVLIARDGEEYIQQLHRALAKRDDPDYLRLLKQEAKENTWDARVEAIMTSLVAAAALRRRYRIGGRFLRAFRRHFSPNMGCSMSDTWQDFALSTNLRGEAAVETVRRYTSIAGKRALDIGCAYGGFPIAFARSGADAVGIDVESALLELAAENVTDMKVPVSLQLKDVTDWAQLWNLGTFDVTTCNDLIEHVEDVPKTVEHIASLLRPGGLLYMQIPNGFSVGQVLKDGHYGLFGITLLSRPDAIRHFGESGFTDAYGVGYFHRLEEYVQLLASHRIHLQGGEIVNTFDDLPGRIDRIRAAVESIRSRLFCCLDADGLSPETKQALREAVDAYLLEVSSELADYEVAMDEELKSERARSLVKRYEIEFWEVIGVKAND